MAEHKRMEVRLFASLYWHEGEHETSPSSPQSVTLWEPLDTEAPEDARPYCYLLNEIDFRRPADQIPSYLSELKPEGWYTAVMYDRHVKHIATRDGFGQPVLVYVQALGTWYELGNGEVVWRNGRWHFKHTGWKNTDAAHFANAGMLGFRHVRENGHKQGWQPYHKLAPAALNFALKVMEADTRHSSQEEFGKEVTRLVNDLRRSGEVPRG